MFTVDEIIKITKGRIDRKRTSKTKVKGISTDTRTLKPGDLFIPLKGENFDGHKFIPQAIKSGAAAILSSKKLTNHPKHVPIIYVRDTLAALHALARAYLQKFNLPVVAITGSSGKTTTKDMTASVLSQKYKVLMNEGNFNNEVGLPLTLFRLKKSHQVAVLEMGMQGLGEIRNLVKIAKPKIAVITNIGTAHLSRLKTRNRIAQAKSEILAAEYAVLNQDDDYFAYLKKKAGRAKVITFSINQKANISAQNIKKEGKGISFDLITPKDRITIRLGVPGLHNIYNALAAAAVGTILGLDLKRIKKGLETFKLSKWHMEIMDLPAGGRIINDTYNANPASMRAALAVLADMNGMRKVAVLADMLELGKSSISEHKKIGEFAAKNAIQKLITVGPHARYIAQAARREGMSEVVHLGSNAEAAEELKSELKSNSCILVKGSRGMRMDEVVEGIKSPF